MEKENKSEKTYSRIKLVSTIILIILVLGAIAYIINTIVKKQNFKVQNPIATIEIADYGTIKLELYPEYAPLLSLQIMDFMMD